MDVKVSGCSGSRGGWDGGGSLWKQSGKQPSPGHSPSSIRTYSFKMPKSKKRYHLLSEMHIPEEVLGIKEICESEKDVGMQDWRYTSCPLLQLPSRGQEEISLTVQLKEHLAIHPGAQIHCRTRLSLFPFQNHPGIQLFKILWLALSWVTRLHKNQEVENSEERLAVKMLVSTDWPQKSGLSSPDYCSWVGTCCVAFQCVFHWRLTNV